MEAQVSQTCRWGSSWARWPPGQPVLLLACGWARRVQVPPDVADALGGGLLFRTPHPECDRPPADP